MATDVTKPWKQKFFEVEDIKAERTMRPFIKPAQHGLLKEKKNADKHSGTGHRTEQL